MATNFLISDSTTQWIANNSGDTYVIEEGVYLAVGGTAISGTAAVTNRKFLIDGHVIGESAGNGMLIGQDASHGGSSTIRIGENGSVLGEAFGVVAHGGGLDLINRGDITGGNDGLYMTGANNAAVNLGTISSYDDTGINSQGAFAKIENHGTVTGVESGVRLAGAASKLTNLGDISSSGGDFATTGIDMSGGNTTLINLGTVSTNGGRVILGGADSQTVVNHGSIEGYVALGDGSDTFENIGGSVNGIVDLGNGSDTFISKNGDVSGSITGGNDHDQYIMYDTSTVITEGVNQGYDAVDAFVSYRLAANFEALLLMGSGNLNGSGNDIANDLIGNAGDNHLFGGGGNDLFSASVGNDRSNGGAGSDTIDFSNDALTAVTVNLATGKGSRGAAGQSFVSIENVIGGDGKDHIIGSAAANHLTGYTGNDVLTGGGGKDVFEFVDTDGTDKITDFKDKTDRIALNYHINGVDIDNFGQLQTLMHQEGKNVVFDFGNIAAGDELVIKNAHVGDFSGADFFFQ